MAQKFLSIRESDYERCKTRTANAPWVRLYRSLFREREFRNMSISSRYLYIGLIMLATEHENRVYNDPTWIGQLLDIPQTEVNLKPLYRGGFLQASNVHRVLREREGEREGERDCASAPLPKVVSKPKEIKRPLPPDFTFDDRSKQMAEGRGLNVHAELSAFKDRNLATGATYIDWQAAFRNWLRNAVKFAAKGGR